MYSSRLRDVSKPWSWLGCKKWQNITILQTLLCLLRWDIFLGGFVVRSLGSFLRANDRLYRVFVIATLSQWPRLCCPRILAGRVTFILNISPDSVITRIRSSILTSRQCDFIKKPDTGFLCHLLTTAGNTFWRPISSNPTVTEICFRKISINRKHCNRHIQLLLSIYSITMPIFFVNV